VEEVIEDETIEEEILDEEVQTIRPCHKKDNMFLTRDTELVIRMVVDEIDTGILTPNLYEFEDCSFEVTDEMKVKFILNGKVHIR
jgi:hypothetical protein